jgi:hypothetical protein
MLYLDQDQLVAALSDLNKYIALRQYIALRPYDPYGYILRAEAYGRNNEQLSAAADLITANRLSILNSASSIELSASRRVDVPSLEDIL